MRPVYEKDALKWVAQAAFSPTAKERMAEHRQNLWNPVVIGDSTLAADGSRLHLVNKVLEVPETLGVFPQNVTKVIEWARQGDIRGTISNWHLHKAATFCGAIARESSNILRMSLNGTWDCAAKSAEYGDAEAVLVDGDVWNYKTVGPVSSSKQRSIIKKLLPNQAFDGFYITSKVIYTHSGNDIELAVDHQLLLEALDGLPEVVEYRMKSNADAIYLCGTVGKYPFEELREAIIMPMHLADRG